MARQAFGPFQSPSFRAVFAARACSLFGDRFSYVAIPFAVLQLTGSASAVGAVLGANAVSLVVFLVVGGVFADRLPRVRLMAGSDLVRFVGQGLTAALLLTGTAELWHLVVLQALHGCASAFFQPAFTGLMPQTVANEQLQRANALVNLADSATAVLGPAVAGLLVAMTNAGWSLAVDSLTFALSAYFLTATNVVRGRATTHRRRFWRELADGWREIRRRTWLGAVILDLAVFQAAALSAFFVLGPYVAQRSLGGAGVWGLILAAFGVGGVFGGTIALYLHPRRLLVWTLLPTIAALPVLLLLAFRGPLWSIAAAAAVSGLAISFATTVYNVSLQQHIPPDVLSRVSAYHWAATSAFRSAGLALVGPLAVLVGTTTTFVATVVIVFAFTLVALGIPDVRRIERTDPGRPTASLEPDGEPRHAQ